MDAFYRAHATADRVLDVGSAGGRNKEFFPNSVTVDIDPKNNPDVVADAQALPFEDGSFDVIVCKEVLEHVKRPEIAIGEFRRVLRSGGKLVLSTRFLFPIHEAPHDHWRFTKYCLEELFRDWGVVEIKDEADPVTTIAILIDRLIYQSDFRFNKLAKGWLYLVTFFILPFRHLLVRQYGDVTKSTPVDSAFTSGYYVVAHTKAESPL
jgi:SAM-dependent methyltransferase